MESYIMLSWHAINEKYLEFIHHCFFPMVCIWGGPVFVCCDHICLQAFISGNMICAVTTKYKQAETSHQLASSICSPLAVVILSEVYCYLVRFACFCLYLLNMAASQCLLRSRITTCLFAPSRPPHASIAFSHASFTTITFSLFAFPGFPWTAIHSFFTSLICNKMLFYSARTSFRVLCLGFAC